MAFFTSQHLVPVEEVVALAEEEVVEVEEEAVVTGRGRGGGDRGGRGRGGGRGTPRGRGGRGGGGGRGGMGGGKKVFIEPHRHQGVFIARGKEDALVTKNMAIGDSVYGEKRIAVEEEGIHPNKLNPK